MGSGRTGIRPDHRWSGVTTACHVGARAAGVARVRVLTALVTGVASVATVVIWVAIAASSRGRW